MSKSFRYKNNMYLDSTGIVHNKKTLNNLVIHDSGSSTNGSWIRFEDGTMICRKIIEKEKFLALQTFSSQVQGITIYRSEAPYIIFAYPFIDANYSINISVCSGMVGTRLFIPRVHAKEKTRVAIQLVGLEDFIENGIGYKNLNNVELIAIGKWK